MRTAEPMKDGKFAHKQQLGLCIPSAEALAPEGPVQVQTACRRGTVREGIWLHPAVLLRHRDAFEHFPSTYVPPKREPSGKK